MNWYHLIDNFLKHSCLLEELIEDIVSSADRELVQQIAVVNNITLRETNTINDVSP